MSNEQCPICERTFSIIRWRYVCQECSRNVCKSCLTQMQKPTEMRQGNYEVYGICKACASEYEKEIEKDPALKSSRDAYQKGVKKGYKKGYGRGYDDGGL